ncbi:flagellar basal body rod protein FlgB [Sphingomonas sanxanigenens]|uniref:Flagellar basal body rod protein FlgB n=1 Tax=Sphingomonas sanxanigenens DSM 19645 = NX02 TaxID=1123269 RepID=W0ACN4_9SPHN|nr:flagellar basal body protein [Sphingomonas sanxanigenens]AHE55654.1 hypothetical protein NX02_19975 [Sphingomonas sanxanigenens DSM 19645 = NX02]
MDQLSSVLLIKALDGLSARAVVTANNIANASTPGYRPMRVSFEAELSQAAAGGPAAAASVMPRIETMADRGFGTDLRLDLELATASSTAARYTALVEVLSRQLQMQSLAARGSL